jgi:hypothetical protein
VLTALGETTLGRDYVSCPACGHAGYPADARLGIVERLTARVRKWACLFGSGWGFAQAADHLADVCGWKLSAQSLKRACYAEAPRIEDWREQEESTAAFAQAEGDVEFLTDGTMVNTVEEGWKEIRVAAFLKRPAGEPARAYQWSTRTLPETTARSVRVAMASAEEFAADWRDWAAQLGIVMTALITVLADGAKWIWNQAGQQFPGARGVLDIFHVLEHLAAATRAVYGEGSGAALAWKDAGLRALLSDGWLGLCDWVGRWRERCDPEHADKVRAATDSVIVYLSSHTDHLGYCERLAKGQSIGSGPIEGACKYVIGRRLKRTGGRWRRDHAVRMGNLCSTHYAGDWSHYWQTCLTSAA